LLLSGGLEFEKPASRKTFYIMQEDGSNGNA
jgi:hypothetical protein